MELATLTLQKTLVMTVLALLGIYCYKRNIVDEEQNAKLSDLVLQVFTPILLFTSFQKEYSSELLQGLIISAVLSAVSFFIIWVICKIVVHRQPKDYACVEHIAIMYSNCGFIGIPMAQGIFGSDGVMYMTTFVAMANFLLWTHGIMAMSGERDFKAVKKVMTSPTIIAIFLGVLCFFLRIRMPRIIGEPMEMVANVNTPMAMFVAGVNIAQADIRKTFRKLRVYWLSFVKLIIMPGTLALLYHFLPIDATVRTVMVLAAACPVGVTGSLFALRFGKDAIYASELFAMSTIISIVTVPFMMIFC